MGSTKIVSNHRYEDIDYKVCRSNRKTISIKVSKTDGVMVLIPMHCDIKIATDAIESKYDWIKKNIKKFDEKQKNIIEQEYVDGATHYLWGKKYTLRILISHEYSLRVDGSEIIVAVPSADKAERVMDGWYLECAKKCITPIFIDMAQKFEQKHSRFPIDLEYKYVKGYWGQCTKDNKIRLNINLARAPRECIEYIIAHELCHLIHKNHSRNFYALLDSEMPQWREYNKILNSTISIKR